MNNFQCVRVADQKREGIARLIVRMEGLEPIGERAQRH
jgi:hypothetical protein